MATANGGQADAESAPPATPPPARGTLHSFFDKAAEDDVHPDDVAVLAHGSPLQLWQPISKKSLELENKAKELFERNQSDDAESAATVQEEANSLRETADPLRALYSELTKARRLAKRNVIACTNQKKAEEAPESRAC